MNYVILTEQRLNQLVKEVAAESAKEGVRAASEWYENRIKKEAEEFQDNLRCNTRLVLEKYRQCKAYVDNAVYDSDSEEESLEEIQRLMIGKVTVEGIKHSVVRTKVMFANVDKALRTYKSYCLTSNDPIELRRWKVIDGLYISDERKSVAELARGENVVERVIYKDVVAACDILGPLFFGFDVITRGRRDGTQN